MMVFRRRLLATCLSLLGCLVGGGGAAWAQFLTISALTPGVHNTSNGSFTGNIGSTTITGSATSATTGSFTFNPTTAGSSGLGGWELSNTADTSQQFKYPTVFFAPQATASTIGYTFWGGATNTARITLNFSRPLSNLVMQIANVDNSIWDFTASGGVTSLNLLKGNNGADGDGIGISGKTIIDRKNGDTGQATTATPFTNPTTNRSAYGTVQIVGTYNQLVIDLTATHSLGGDGGNFTLAAVPEPASLSLALLGVAALWVRRRTTP